MATLSFKLNARAALLGLIAAAYPVIGYTAPAARVDFATGNVKAVAANGQTRTLAKGAQVEQGETISTNNGRAQLRFTDGAYVSLQPESEFRIDQYRFDGKQDGNEKGFFSLVKGGLRTITGLVGRNNKNNYQVTTSVATIGIRGTEYTIQYGQSVTGSVGEGEINVCNGAGCMSVTNGESYYVQSQSVKPVLTNKRSDLPPPPPASPPPTIKQGENVGPDGIQCDVGGGCASAPFLTGTGNFNVGYVGSFFGPGVKLNSTATLDNGQLLSFDRGFLDTLTGPFQDVGGDNILVWGRAASNSGGEVTHYVAGVPTSDLTALGGKVASYTMAGATAITNSSGTPVGTLREMSMTADFAISNLSVAMKMTLINGNGASIDRNSISGSGSMSNGVLSFFASQSVASGSVSVSANGFFAGTNAVRAGFAYSVNDNELGIDGRGAVGLKQTTVGNSPNQ